MKDVPAGEEDYLDSIPVDQPLAQLSSSAIQALCDARLTSHRKENDWVFSKTTLASLLKLIFHHTSPDVVLDFGCGDGLIVEVLKETPAFPPSLKVRGFDFSPLAIQLAQARTAVDSEHTFTLLTDEIFEGPALQYSAAVANFVMHFYVPDEHLRWLASSLKSGGLFAYNDHRYERDRAHYLDTKERLRKLGLKEIAETEFVAKRRDGHMREQRLVLFQKQLENV